MLRLLLLCFSTLLIAGCGGPQVTETQALDVAAAKRAAQSAQDPSDEVRRLLDAAGDGDDAALEVLVELMSDPLALPRTYPNHREMVRAQIAGGLAGMGHEPAFELTMARIRGESSPPPGDPDNSRAWYGALLASEARFSIASGLLVVIAAGGPSAEHAANIAPGYAEIDEPAFQRALLRGDPTLARRVLRRHLSRDPRQTLEALVALTGEPDAAPSAVAFLTHVTGEDIESHAGWEVWLPHANETRRGEIRLAASARRVCGFFPGREDEAALRAAWTEKEQRELGTLRLGAIVGTPRAGQNELAVRIEEGTVHARSFGEESALILTVTDANGRSAQATTTTDEPAPQRCRSGDEECELIGDDGSGGRQLRFQLPHPSPLFTHAGRYTVRVDSTYGAVSWGPTDIDVQ